MQEFFICMDNAPRPGKSRAVKILKLLLKLVVSGLCLWYVSEKINWQEARAALSGANPGWLALAALLFVLSKILSSFRLTIYFRDIDTPISEAVNLKLYWLGMFYNLFLPGGISGDAYKVILLKQWFQTPYKRAGAAVLLDRVSGLLALVWILAVYGWFVLPAYWQKAGLLILVLGGTFAFRFFVGKWMNDFKNSFWPTLVWGLGVQLAQVLAIYAIISALGLPMGEPAYLFLFLLSSIAAVLPLSIGGLGIREIVFLHGAAYFGLQEATAVLISLAFYLITLLCSLPGIWFVFHSPNKKPDHKSGRG